MDSDKQTRQEAQATGYKFYKTFGKISAPRKQHYPLWRWAVVLGVLAIIYGVGTAAYLFINSARAEFEASELPPFDKSLAFVVPGARYQVGESAYITMTLVNPSQSDVPIKGITIQLPATFLDAFTVDNSKCSVERRNDASGIIRCPDNLIHDLRTETIGIPLRASRPGNYTGDMSLQMALLLPLARHPWYVPVDGSGNYKMLLEERKRLDLRIVPKP